MVLSNLLQASAHIQQLNKTAGDECHAFGYLSHWRDKLLTVDIRSFLVQHALTRILLANIVDLLYYYYLSLIAARCYA